MRQHLAFFAPHRVGAHMLRSMLVADTKVFDGGEYGGGGNPDRSGPGYELHLQKREAQTLPDKIILTNPKIRPRMDFDGIAKVIVQRRIPVLLLLRHDILAMVASKELAARHGSWHRPGPPLQIALGDRHARHMMDVAIAIEQCKLALRDHGIAWDELQYSDLVMRDKVVRKTINSWAGQEIAIGEPTTKKMSPPLNKFVLNISDRKAWFKIFGRD